VITETTNLESCLRDRFGLDAFRPGQREVIETVLARRDCLCVMPTGGGKSLCYQLPSLLLDGVTLVVSPLIALMKDQVDGLIERGIRATLINSTLDAATQNERIAATERGEYDLVYVAPERFRSSRFNESIARTRVALLAVDEAHCISEWGHDFRPDYIRLGRARKRLNNPPTIALTATATDNVRRDICEQLDLADPRIFVTGFDRPNLRYEVRYAPGDAAKQDAVKEVLGAAPGSGIIYCATRKRCEEVADFLRDGVRRKCLVYHAGMPQDDRRRAQDAFMTGRDTVVVATNAFGMGVDKPDIRFVVHYNLPGTIEAYYQEAGRSGRDGLESRCVLLYAPSDRFIQEFFIDGNYPSREVVGAIYQFLARQDANPIELTQEEIKERLGLSISDMGVGTSLKLLDGAGLIERLRPRENMAIVRIDSEVSLVGLLPSNAAVQRRVLSALERLVQASHGDDTYFQPHQLAYRLELEPQQVSRAIHEMCEKLPIEYVPPFRGNAIRMRDHTRTPATLGIDFESLEARKAREFDKLDQVIDYARCSECRRRRILHYFGDHTPVQCGHCDNCQSGAQKRKPTPNTKENDRDGERPTSATKPSPTETDPDQTTDVIRKILSGIARAKGRYGKSIVAAMLTGSESKAMRRGGLNKLSTYGLLDKFTQNEVAQIIELLIAVGWVEQVEVDKFRPVISVGPIGWQVMTGERAVDRSLPLPDYLLAKLRRGGPSAVTGAISSEQPAPPASDQPVDRELLTRLREARDRWADEARVQRYQVLHNAVLEELARVRPATLDGLLAIKGIGPAKVARYGERLLEILSGASARIVGLQSTRPVASSASSAANRADSPAPTARDRVAEVQSPPAHYWTWRLLERGFTQAECALIRGLDEQTVLEHAIAAGRAGRAVSLDAFLPAELIDLLARAIAATPPEEMDSVLEDLPPEISEQHVQLYLVTQRTPPEP
jgi:ATP-dependent DNA helicase RecQ